MALYISGFKWMHYYGTVGALELHIQMDPLAARLAKEPGCSVYMDTLQASICMHTDTWSLWMPSWWTHCHTATQVGYFTMSTQLEGPTSAQ